MSKTPPKTPTRSAIAKALSVSPARVTQLRAQGMPTDSTAAAKRWRDKQEGRHKSKADTAEIVRQRRAALLLQQERKARVEADKAAGLLMERGEHIAAMITSATAARMGLYDMLHTLPPILEGLDALAICRRLRDAFDQVCDRLHQGDPELWESPIGKAIISELETRIRPPHESTK